MRCFSLPLLADGHLRTHALLEVVLLRVHVRLRARRKRGKHARRWHDDVHWHACWHATLGQRRGMHLRGPYIVFEQSTTCTAGYGVDDSWWWWCVRRDTTGGAFVFLHNGRHWRLLCVAPLRFELPGMRVISSHSRKHFRCIESMEHVHGTGPRRVYILLYNMQRLYAPPDAQK